MELDTSWGAVVTEKPIGDITVQGSEAWKAWRGKGLGSSDAAVLLGWSPWKTIDQLYQEKLGLWKPEFGWAQKKAMARGTELEPVIRKWYENLVGYKMTEATQEDLEFTYRRASFDGINREHINEDGSIGKIIEIKAPNAKDHALARNGMVTEKYIAQIQWLMLVAGVQWCDYVSYGSDDTYAVVPVKADPRIQKELSERAHIFWKHIETKTPVTHWEEFRLEFQSTLDLNLESVPVKLNDTKSVKSDAPKEEPKTIGDQEIEGIVAEALLAQKEADFASAKFEALKEKLKQILGNNERLDCAQASFGWQKRKGAVDYSVIPELIGIELDQFRKPDTRAFYFKKIDQK